MVANLDQLLGKIIRRLLKSARPVAQKVPLDGRKRRRGLPAVNEQSDWQTLLQSLAALCAVRD